MKTILTSSFLLFIFSAVFAQTPGSFAIAPPSGNSPFDPNGDGYVTLTGNPFTTNEYSEFEIGWKALPVLTPEGSGDQRIGPNCGKLDVASDPSNQAAAAYAYFDNVDGISGNSNDLLMFRLRGSKESLSGNLGISVLIDTDLKLGFSGPNADPNAIPGNPGFELEIRVRTNGGPSVSIYNVDGSLSGTLVATYPLSTNYAQAYSFFGSATCTGNPVFHDFYVQLSDLGIGPAQQFRISIGTTNAGGTALNGGAADFAGVNDMIFRNQDDLFIALINGQTPATPGDLGPGSHGFPVELVQFEAVAAKSEVKLTWVTASELNNDYFTVERSLDGIDFQPVIQVDGAGTSLSVRSYETVDHAPFNGISYYRLRQTDFDGKFTFSSLVEVNLGETSRIVLQAWPNPSAGKFNLEISGLNDDTAELLVLNPGGQVVFQENLTTLQSQSQIALDLSGNPAGIYFLRIRKGNTHSSLRLVVN
ncbi:MAG: T9SS type A sorting domain-containing protein [Bacteroidia bacterium]|nr:T9SS type A sorting domain-containing protein [Bacteroidia bacterium]